MKFVLNWMLWTPSQPHAFRFPAVPKSDMKDAQGAVVGTLAAPLCADFSNGAIYLTALFLKLFV